MDTVGVGKSVQRVEAWDKVTGNARYTDDFIKPGILHARMVSSIFAHAHIRSIDITEALDSPGVQAVITGKDFPILKGPVIEDHPPLAIDKVRYYGEPVAVVIANTEFEAASAAEKVYVDYELLPVVNSVREALAPDAPLVHNNLNNYEHVVDNISSEANTNITDRTKICKGDINRGWAESELVIEETYNLPQSDHLAMETRTARAVSRPDGSVLIHTSSQAPFAVKEMIAKYFNVTEGKITVKTPLVGGAFGGKSAVQLEFIAFIASRAVGGERSKDYQYPGRRYYKFTLSSWYGGKD